MPNKHYYIRCLPPLTVAILTYNEYILPQSSRDFDPEAHPELKKPPDPNEIRSQGIKQSFYFDPDKNYIKLYQEISRNDPASPTLDP